MNKKEIILETCQLLSKERRWTLSKKIDDITIYTPAQVQYSRERGGKEHLMIMSAEEVIRSDLSTEKREELVASVVTLLVGINTTDVTTIIDALRENVFLKCDILNKIRNFLTENGYRYVRTMNE